jgi:hypothetical protein
MAIAVAVFERFTFQDRNGVDRSYNALHVTGMTAGAANTIPLTDADGNPIIRGATGQAVTPAAVDPVGWSTDGSYRAAPSLDGSTYAAGFTATDAYVITAAGVTTCKLILIG